jgi:hypothetical protein
MAFRTHGLSAATLALAALAALAPSLADASNGRPRVTHGPSVSGTAQVGEPLTATATWTGAAPITASWAWQRCGDGSFASCAAIPGATSARYVPVAADVGKRLRVRLDIRNGKGSAWAIPEATDVVAPAPAGTPVPTPTPAPPPSGGAKPLRMLSPRPVVRITGRLTKTGAHVAALTVRAPRGAHIAVRCQGSGCPRRHWAGAASLVHVVPFERDLRAGTRIVITVTRRGYIGKHTVIVVRRGHPPARRDACLFPGSSKPRRCPSA